MVLLPQRLGYFQFLNILSAAAKIRAETYTRVLRERPFLPRHHKERIVMTTKTVVADEQAKLVKPTDEQIATYTRRRHELDDRFLKGVRGVQGVLDGLQILIERDFMEDFFLDTGELSIQIPALPRPTLEELQKDRSNIKSIKRDTSTTEPTILKLYTVLRPTENSINGTEYERRILVRQNSLLGFQHRNWVRDHQDEHPALKELFGKVYIDFPALIAVGGDGDRRYPFLVSVGGRWLGRWDWIDYGFHRDGRVASK
ncbi:MAG: hypothetical protein AAB602_02080 [Patescibacteria group bacterium]